MFHVVAPSSRLDHDELRLLIGQPRRTQYSTIEVDPHEPIIHVAILFKQREKSESIFKRYLCTCISAVLDLVHQEEVIDAQIFSQFYSFGEPQYMLHHVTEIFEGYDSDECQLLFIKNSNGEFYCDGLTHAVVSTDYRLRSLWRK